MRAWQRWHATSCYACGRNLAYQSGAAVVKCPGCESVLNVRGLALQDVAGQAECTGCHQIMVFPAAAAAMNTITSTHPPVVPGLLCTTCSSCTPAPQPLYFNCAGCRLYVTYCARLSDVICAVCLTVFPPYNPPSPYPALAPLNPALRRPQRPPPVLPPSGARNSPMLLRRSWLQTSPPLISQSYPLPSPSTPTFSAPTSSFPTTTNTTTALPISPQPTTPDLSITLQPPLSVNPITSSVISQHVQDLSVARQERKEGEEEEEKENLHDTQQQQLEQQVSTTTATTTGLHSNSSNSTNSSSADNSQIVAQHLHQHEMLQHVQQNQAPPQHFQQHHLQNQQHQPPQQQQ